MGMGGEGKRRRKGGSKKGVCPPIFTTDRRHCKGPPIGNGLWGIDDHVTHDVT